MKRYAPRRAGKRWLEGAPDYILDCFDDKGPGERYTVLFGPALAYRTLANGTCADGPGEYRNTHIQGLGMSEAPTHPQGVSLWFEMKAYEAAAYRYRSSHQRVRWMDLPEHIRRHVIARATQD